MGSDLDGLSDNDGDAADAEATVTESSDLDFSPPASEEERDEEAFASPSHRSGRYSY